MLCPHVRELGVDGRVGSALGKLVEIPSYFCGFGSRQGNLCLLWGVLLPPGWCRLAVAVAVEGPEGKAFCFFPIFFFFGFEIHFFRFFKPSLPAAALGLGLAGVFPCAGRSR